VTPTNADPSAPTWAVDTSVAVAYLDASHSAHETCVAALVDRQPALSGHATFETYSVLTRLPGRSRISPSDALAALRAAFPDPCWLMPDEHTALLDRLEDVGIVGGRVYDALVGEAARVRERILLTRDQRAIRTYDLLGIGYEVVAEPDDRPRSP
jgi:predicted nucleic acid-binding protein